MGTLENKTTVLTLAYEPDYIIEDEILPEPFVVLKAINIGRQAWWNKGMGKQKVTKLIKAFKADMTTDEACIYAGITKKQYTHFSKIHSSFVATKARCKRVLAIGAKIGMSIDVMTPGKEGARARQWYLERRQPHIYGRDIGAYTPPPPEAAKKITGEAFLDKDGKILISKQTAEVLKREYGDGDNTDGQEKSG